MFPRRFVGFGLLVCAAAMALVSAAPAPAPPKAPRELLEKRRDAARKVFNEKLQRIRMGLETPGAEPCEWSKRWLEAEMALNDKKADRIAALTDHLKRVSEVERVAAGLARTGQLRLADADAATYYRVDAEIRLFEATGKLPPPPPEGYPAPLSPGKKPAPRGREVPPPAKDG